MTTIMHEWLSETVNTLKKAGMIKDKLRIAGQEVEVIYFHLPSEPHGYLSNWYLRFEFGRRHLRIHSIILATALLVIGFCIVIGGAI